MAKLIDKDALVAEIERRIKFQQNCIKTEYRLTGKAEEEIILEYKQLLSHLDTLEVKEVDLEKEIQAFALLELEPLKIYDANVGISITMHQLYQCAKHFFKLGLKAKQS